MNRFRDFIAVAAFSFLVLGVPAIASAQFPGNGGYYPNGGYDPNGGYYGNNGQYGNWNMRAVVRNLKNRTKDFQRAVDRELDRSRYDGTRREDEMNRLVKDFRKSVDRLHSSDRPQKYEDVRRVLDLGAMVDRQIVRSRIGYSVQQMWPGIRNDLQILANAHGMSNRNNRYPGWGNTRGTGRTNFPSWWPF